MSDPGRATITREHVETARAVVGSWAEDRPGINVGELTGLVAQAVADAYYAGYSEGLVSGRRIAANVVKEALHDEGLL